MMRTTIIWPAVRFLVLFLTAMTCGAGITPAQSSAGDASGAPVRRAILIGINQYLHVPKLNGSLNDVEAMRQVLTSRLGFAPEHITTVTDAAATRDGILAALERFVKDTGPDDVVYVHYSGHGSQVQDFNGDEKDDGLDETLIPQDGRGGNVPDITDDELDEMFSRLKARSVLIVLDSCHSGTATRGVTLQTRSVPQDTRLDLYRKAGPQTRGVVPLAAAGYVLMTGAASHQSALDGPVNGRYHGFFSYSLSRSLGAFGPAATPRAVFAGIEQELKRIQAQLGRSSMPEPQLETLPEKLDQPLLAPPGNAGQSAAGAGSLARLPWVQVIPHTGKTVRLVNGISLGALPGSLWAIYPPGDTVFSPGRAMAVVSVSQIQGSDAQADILPPARSVPAEARAIALAPPSPPGRVPVRLRDVPADRTKTVEKVLRKRLGDVEIVGAGQFARFVLDVKKDTLQIHSADGLQLVASFSMKDKAWADALALVVSRSANASELLTLDNPSTRLSLQARVVTQLGSRAVPITGSRGVAVVGDTQASRYRIRNPAEPRHEANSLQIEVQTNTDGYLTVVDVDSQGGLNLLFPNPMLNPAFAPEGFVRGSQPILIPDSLQSGNRAGFHWDYAPPAGQDTIRVFFSTDVETARMIRQRVQTVQPPPGMAFRGAVATRGAVAKNLKSLRQDLAKTATRGIITVPDQPEAGFPGQAPMGAPPPAGFPPTPMPGMPPYAEPQGQGFPGAGGVPGFPGTIPGTPPGGAPVISEYHSLPDWTATSLTVLVEG